MAHLELTELLAFLLLLLLPEQPSKPSSCERLEREPPFLDDSDTFFFFFLLEVSWLWLCFWKVRSHCSSPELFSSAFSSSSCKAKGLY